MNANRSRRRAPRWLPSLLAAALLALATATPAHAAPLDADTVVDRVEPGLVQISTIVDFQGVVGNGAGIVLTPDGEILTNHHVVQGANSIRVAVPAVGQVFDADPIGYDRGNDVALLRLRGAAGLPVAPLGNSDTVAVGDPVITLGNANGTGQPFTHEQGTVVALDQSISAEDGLTGSSHELDGLIESSTNLRSGDSGGALANSAGQVIGMNAAATLNFRIDGESVPAGQGYAVPINQALVIADQIRAGAASPSVHIGPSAMLGVGINAAAPSGSRGLPIRTILPGGPADQAGLRVGDVIVAIDGTPINSANALTSLLDQRYPGDVIDVTFTDRFGQSYAAKVTLVPGPVS